MMSDGARITYMTMTGATARRWFTAMVDLYALVYAEPPYEEGPDEVKGFAKGLPEEASRPGFFGVLAAFDGQLTGVAYGWTMPADTWWSAADETPPGHIKGVDKFAVMEWIVHPNHRRHGVGTELMRMLLDERTEPWATLASDPRSAAREIYERAGWQQIGTSALPWGPPMHLLALPLH